MTFNSAFASAFSPLLLPMGFKKRGRMFGKYMEDEKLFIYVTYETFYGGRNFRIWTSIVSAYEPKPIYNGRALITEDDKCGAIRLCIGRKNNIIFDVANDKREKYTPELLLDGMKNMLQYYTDAIVTLNSIRSLDALYDYTRMVFREAFNDEMRISLLPLACMLNRKEDLERIAEHDYCRISKIYEGAIVEQASNHRYILRLREWLDGAKTLLDDMKNGNLDPYIQEYCRIASENETEYRHFIP